MTAAARERVAPPQGRGRLLAGTGSRRGLAGHLATFGPLAAPDGLVELVEAAGLKGRGGAAFPTAAKLAVVAARRGAVVVANGAEGEPASRKDRALLRVAPHLVLDGAALAAGAVGARTAVLAVSTGCPELQAAVRERQAARLDRVSFELAIVPDAFVAGEETALLRALEGAPAKPTLKPPYPFDRGLGGRPTLVQNVETLAHIALIARFGPEWFGEGTALVTLGGAVAQAGVHEIALGTPLADAIRLCGGADPTAEAFLIGGYFGRWYPAAAAADLLLTPDVLGAGAIVALPRTTCAAGEVARVIRYLADESAGQCGPCVHGLGAIAAALDLGGRGDHRGQVQRWARMVHGRGACRHPDGAVRFVESALEVFAGEFNRHASHLGCGHRVRGVLPVPVDGSSR